MGKHFVIGVTVVLCILTVSCTNSETTKSSYINSLFIGNSAASSASICETESVSSSASTSNESTSTNTISFSASDLEGKSVFEFMDENGITTLNADSTDAVYVALFQMFCEEMFGIYHFPETLKSIKDGDPYTPLAAVSVLCAKYSDLNSWMYIDGIGDGFTDTGNIDQIEKLGQEGRYRLVDYYDNEIDSSPDNQTIVTVQYGHVTAIRIGENLTFYKPDFDIEEYINSHYLEGTYEDGNGITYTFGSDMNAVWGDRTFTYRLYNWDYWETFADWGEYYPLCVMSSSENRTTDEYYAYQRVDDKLYLYNATPWGDVGLGFDVNKQPYLVLDKIG